MTGIDRKVFLRALSWLWDRGNRRRIGGDMTKWSLWQSHIETIWEPPMKLAFFNFKFSTKWIDYWLRELEERGNAQKHTFTILFSIHYYRKIQQTLADVRILLSWSHGGMHWWHQKGYGGSCNEPCNIWVYEHHIHKDRRVYQENDKRYSCSHNIIKYRMTQGIV